MTKRKVPTSRQWPKAPPARPNNADARECDDPAVLRAALRRLYDVCQSMDAEKELDRPSEEEYQAAIAQAVRALQA